MTLHATALAQPMAKGELYLEIEGIPYAFGTVARGASWFNVAGQAFEGIKPALRIVDTGDLPTISAQRVDFIESRVSIGSLRVGIVDSDARPAYWAANTAYVVGDEVDTVAGRIYRCTVAGTSGSTEPSHTSGTATDGTVTWRYVSTEPALDDNGNTLAGYVAPWRRDNVLRLVNGTSTTVSASNTGDTTILVTNAAVVALGSEVEVAGSSPKVVVSVDRTANTITLSSALASVPISGSVVTLALSASTVSTTATVDGDTTTAGNVADWPASGVCWLGTEACAFTRSGSALTLTRAQYRSQVATHQGRYSRENETGRESRVSLYPDGLVGRRCWLRWGLDADSDADAADLFVGSVAGAQWDTGGRTLILELEDAQTWLRKPLFTDLPDRMEAGATAQRVTIQGYTRPIRTAGLLDSQLPDGGQTVAAIGPSVFLLERDTIAVLKETLFGETLATGLNRSAPVLPMRPAIFIGPSVSANATSGVINQPHPLKALLAILTSTGTGTNGTYDTLPAEWGLGVPQASIDVAGIEELAKQTPALAEFRAFILEPVDDFREWAIATLLKPFGFALRPSFTYPIAVKQILAPTPDDIADATALGLSDLATNRDGSFVLMEGPTQENATVVGSVTVLSSPYIDDGEIEWGDKVRLGIISSDVRRGYQSAQPVEFESWLPRDEAPRGTTSKFNAFYQGLLANIWGRFEAPPTVLRVAVRPNPFVRLNAGDYVSVTIPNLPSAFGNTRGFDSVIMEVGAKSIDLPGNNVVLELVQTAITLRKTRYIGPGLAVTAFANDTPTAGQSRLTVSANAYTDAAQGYVDTGAFSVGQNVVVSSGDFVTRATAAITAVTSTTIEIDKNVATLGATPAAGWHVTHANYDSATDAMTSRYSYCADSSARLGASNLAPHVYA